MRKIIGITLIVVAFLVIGYFVYLIVHKINIKKEIAEKTATIPQFSFTTIQRQTFTKQNIHDTLGNVIIQLFSPDCEHCQYMAESFVKNKEKIQGTEIIMITPFADSSSAARFAQTYHLNSLKNVHLLLDTKAAFFKIFGSSLVPSFYVYKNNKLVKTIKGETRIENLLN
jgi:thiol-disulfide isomerase/thioredoxin